jgi:hypothetical protein
MMGHHARSESLFYYFRLEDQVPENHLLRLIDFPFLSLSMWYHGYICSRHGYICSRHGYSCNGEK